MKTQRRKPIMLGLLGMALCGSTLAGCSGRNGAPSRWTDEPSYTPDQPRYVRKPPLGQVTNPKPVFLGGYAGANY